MYRLFYNYKIIGDVLLIVMSDKEMTSYKKCDDLVLIYSNDELVGINLFNFSRIVKTFANGIIINPPNAIIDIVNNYLTNAGVKPLEYQTNSGFVIGKVIKYDSINNVYKYIVDIGKEISVVNENNDYAIGEYVLISVPGCVYPNGNIVKDYKIVKPNDIGLEDELFDINKEYEVGNDYFKEC